MFDSFTRRIPWVVAAVVALAVIGVPASAQNVINADKVDGRSAVKYTTDLNLRGGRLMSFSKAGYLPSNIVQGGVATIAALQSSAGAVNEADNPVHWNQIQGVPATVINPSTVVTTLGPTVTIPGGGASFLYIEYPANRAVLYELYPVTPGGIVATTGDLIGRSVDSTIIAKVVSFANFSAVTPVTVGVRLTVLSQNYVSPAKVKDLISAKFLDKRPKLFRR